MCSFSEMESTVKQPSSEEQDEEQDLIVDEIKPIVLSKRLKCLDNADVKLNNCDSNDVVAKDQRSPSPDVDSLRKYPKILNPHSSSSIISHNSSPNFQRENSIRSLKNYHHIFNHEFNGKPSSSDSGSQVGSMRSWASVGMGSTDGKKMIVRRVPTSPVELFNIVNPPTYVYLEWE